MNVVTSSRRKLIRIRSLHGFIALVIFLFVIIVTLCVKETHGASVARHRERDIDYDVMERARETEETSFEEDLRSAIEQQRRLRRRHRKLAMRVRPPPPPPRSPLPTL